MIALLPGGLELAYDEAGSGLPLLLVHAGRTTARCGRGKSADWRLTRA